MSQLASHPSSMTPPAIASRLNALRRRVLTWLIVDGLCRWMLLLVGLIALDLAVDWFFHLDFAQRVIMLGLCVVALVAGAYWWLIRPLLHRPNDDALCLQVEGKHRELREVVISSLQFSRMEIAADGGISPELVRATIEQGVAAAEGVNFGETLNQKRFRVDVAVLALSTIFLVLVGVAIVQQLALFDIWFNRNVLLGNKEWWRDTYLVVEGADEDGMLRLTRGEDHNQAVIVRDDSKVIPDQVFLEFRDGGARAMEEMKPIEGSDGKRFELLLRNVATPFRFRAVGGRDGQSDWVQIELVDAPAIETLTMTVQPPAYTEQTVYELPAGSGPYHILQGSTLQLQGVSNKPLSEGSLKVAGKSWELDRQSDREFSLSIPAEAIVAGTYEFYLVDTSGLSASRPDTFDLRIKPDREPKLSVKTSGVSGMVVPRAQIPIDAQVSDDFAVTDLKLLYEWRGTSSDSVPQGGEFTFSGLGGRYGFPELDLDKELFDLEALNIPTGAGLKFKLVATDNDAVSGAKSGESSEVLLRIVTEEELRTDLLRREREQRQELERILKNQEDLLIEVTAMLADVKSGDIPLDNLRPGMRSGLLQMNRSQKVVGTNVAAIASRFEEFLIEVVNNRIDEENGNLRRRLLDAIITPLQELDQYDIQDSVRGIELSRRSLDQTEGLEQALTETVASQRAIVSGIKDVLEAMVKAEGYQEAVKLLNEIKQAEEEVLRMTKQRQEERIRILLENGGLGGDDNAGGDNSGDGDNSSDGSSGNGDSDGADNGTGAGDAAGDGN